jgi:hypothetical protein
VPGIAILPRDLDPQALLAALSRHMWLPEIVLPNDGLPTRSIVVHSDGRLTFNIRAPNLYLKSYLARFAEEEEDGYRITRLQ